MNSQKAIKSFVDKFSKPFVIQYHAIEDTALKIRFNIHESYYTDLGFDYGVELKLTNRIVDFLDFACSQDYPIQMVFDVVSKIVDYNSPVPFSLMIAPQDYEKQNGMSYYNLANHRTNACLITRRQAPIDVKTGQFDFCFIELVELPDFETIIEANGLLYLPSKY